MKIYCGRQQSGLMVFFSVFKHFLTPSPLWLASSVMIVVFSNLFNYTFQKDSCLAIIPNACSAKLQPLHQGIKEKFKVSFLL